jgi:uncharacterized protein with GYD domain
MAHYLVQLAYTPQAWAAQIKNPQDRTAAVRPLFDKLGARIVTSYISFGKYDIVLIMEAPDNISAAAIALAITAGGAVKAYETTPLMSPEEGVEAMRKAAAAAPAYPPPA